MTEWMDKIPYDAQSEAYGEVHQAFVDLRRDGMRNTSGTECSVLLIGDSGTSFGGIAKHVVQISKVSSGPYVVSGFPSTEEIQAAQGGTLFIKHLENLSFEKQETLYRNLSNRGNVRVVASAHRSFEEGIAIGKTSPNLYRLVSEKIVHLPKLVSRKKEEISKLAHFVATKMCVEAGRSFSGFEPSVEAFFQNYNWPGNEGEMVAVVERSLILAKGKKVGMSDIVLLPDSNSKSGPIEIINPNSTTVTSTFTGDALAEGYTELKKRWGDAFEKEFLVASLKRHTGNVSQAAREAKLDRSNYLRLLRRHGIKAEVFRHGATDMPETAEVSKVTEIKRAA